MISNMNRKDRIQQNLSNAMTPVYLLVEDESHRHHVPENAETHFKVTLVSTAFDKQTKVNRHRLVNKLLAQEFETGLHALSLHLYTPEEWEKIEKAPRSPACRDGYQHG